MARTGITYLEVTTAIDKIIASGDEPTIQKIRDVLGTGSPNTIHRFLTEWRAARPVEQRKAVELPADLAAALLKEIERQAADARAEVEKQLVAAQAEAAELASTGEELESDLESAREESEVKANEITNLKSDFDRVTDSLSRAMHELEAERKVTNEQRDSLALSQNRVMTLTDQVTDLKSELATTKADAKAALDAQVQAEKVAAVTAAQLEAEKAKTADLVSRLNAANDALAKLSDRYETKVAEYLKAKEDLTYCERHIVELNQEISEHIAAYKNSERIANELKAEIKHHLGELDIAQAEIDELKKEIAAVQVKSKK